MSTKEKELQKAKDYCNNITTSYMSKFASYLYSGAVDVDSLEEDSFMLQLVVASLLSDSFMRMSEEAKKLRNNLKHF